MNNFKPSMECFSLAMQFEGCKLKSYQDERGIWTIGIGHTKGVYENQTITIQKAQELFYADMNERAQQVNAVINSNINQNQFDACLDFVFNCGIGNFMQSTLLKLINANSNDQNIEAQFLVWNKIRINGILMPSKGLLRRRQAEWYLYSKQIN